MKRLLICVFLLTALLFMATAGPSKVVYRNGLIYTMDNGSSIAAAFLVENGKFRQVGGDEILSHPVAQGAAVVDLQRRVVLPGFVDAHSHFPGTGLRRLGPELRPSPVGSIDSIDVLLDAVRREHATLSGKRWLLGFNYDNTVFDSGAHPTRQQLDEISSTRPIYLWHQSGHMGVANSAALKILGYDANSPDPIGGKLGRRGDTQELNGLLQESAAPTLSRLLRSVPKQDLLKVLFAARDDYLAAGVTTVQDGFAGRTQMRLWYWAQALKLLPQRIVVWPAHVKFERSPKIHFSVVSPDEKFHIGPVKVITDGSPQGLTAYLSKPYHAAVLSQLGKDYRGVPARPFVELNKIVSDYHVAGFNLAIHGNGDAAIDDALDAIEDVQIKHPRAAARHIIVHAQTVRQDQLKRMAALNVSASFFVNHTYYWGEWHKKRSLGPSRAQNISPTAWADEAGVRYSLHSDAPVTPMNPLELVWSANNRIMQSGGVLGAHQRISVQRALRAVTIDAAWQNGLEHDRGSIEVGKHADFIVLSADPHEHGGKNDVRVTETFIAGVKRYELLE